MKHVPFESQVLPKVNMLIKYELKNRLKDKTITQINNPRDVGLAGHCFRMEIFVGQREVVIHKSDDFYMRLFGKFEQVDPNCRVELGSYVVYNVGSKNDPIFNVCTRAAQLKRG